MSKRLCYLTRLAAITAAAAAWCALPPAAQAQATGKPATIGTVTPLAGAVNEVAVDEARGLVYAGNFSAGRVDVISMATHQRVASFPTTPATAAVSDMAISRDKHYLVATNLPVGGSGVTLGGVTVVNLNNTSDRRTFAIDRDPLAVAFGANGRALVVTKSDFRWFEPAGGTFETVFTLEDPTATGLLPTAPASLPREIVRAGVGASGDGNWVFGVTDAFVFGLRISPPLLSIRPTSMLIHPPLFNQVSVSEKGDYFMVGQLLMSSDLRVIADTAEAPASNPGFLGGHVVDGARDTVYASFDRSGGFGQGELMLMDADNLFVRQRLRLPEPIAGRLALDATGENLWGVSASGVVHVPVGDLSKLPVVEVDPADRNVILEFNFCAREPASQTVHLVSPGGAPAAFSLSAAPLNGGASAPVLFEPHQGVTPADVRVTVDPTAVGPIQGTAVFAVVVESLNAINIPQTATVSANIRDVDQKGQFQAAPGRFVDIVADPVRDRFYALDQRNFQVHVFDSNTLRLLGSFRVGNTPTWMSTTRDGARLLVANSRSENLTQINLNTMRVEGRLFVPWQTVQEGHYPFSIAADNSTILVGARTSAGGGRIDRVTQGTPSISMPQSLGIYVNSLGSQIAMVPQPNGAGIFIADSQGGVMLWEALSGRAIAARRDFASLSGGIGAGLDYFVAGSNLLNRSLVSVGQYPDAGAGIVTTGLAVLPDGHGVRAVGPNGQPGSGVLQKLDAANPLNIVSPVRTADQPPSPDSNFAFVRSVARLRDGRLAAIGQSGVIVFPLDYDQGTMVPQVKAMTSAADFSSNLGAGGLVSIFGDGLAPETAVAANSPLPTLMANTCVTANGLNLPLLYVSPTQINAQLPFAAVGEVSTVVHTSGGLSDIHVEFVGAASPSIFGIPGPNNERIAAVLRAKNGQVSSLSNPFRPNEVAVIFATGMGQVAPFAVEGYAAPNTPLTTTLVDPLVNVGGVQADILFSGLAPGFVGLYQINVRLPGNVPLGLQIPMTLRAGGTSTTVNLRIID